MSFNKVIYLLTKQTYFSNFIFQALHYFSGPILAISAGLFFAAQYTIAKFIQELSRAEIAFLRYFGVLFISFPVLLDSGEPWLGPSNWTFRLCILARGSFGATAMLFKFYAMQHISLANATVIRQSSPVFVFVLARIFLKETFTRYHGISLVLSLVGIALASKLHVILLESGSSSPVELMLSNVTAVDFEKEVHSSSYFKPEVLHILLGNFYAAAATLSAAAVCVLLRKMKAVHHSVINFLFSAIAMILLSPLAFAVDDFVIPINGYLPYLLIALGTFAYYSQLTLVKAIQKEEAGVVSIIKDSSEVSLQNCKRTKCFNFYFYRLCSHFY